MRRISIHHLNLVLFCTIAGLAFVYSHELKWSIENISKYRSQQIPSPEETVLYRNGIRWIETDPERAQLMFERSLAIDPRCEAGFWLAEAYYQQGKRDQALAQYEKYLRIDPNSTNSYYRIAQLYRSRGELATARKTLQDGVAYFDKVEKVAVPHFDQTVAGEFNEKAANVHQNYMQSKQFLNEHLKAIEAYHPSSQ